MQTLISRLVNTLGFLDQAAVAFAVDSLDDDGKARSLGNDLRWLRDRFVDRLRVERERVAKCEACGGTGQAFACPSWPACKCPAGTISKGCPGKTTACPACGGTHV